MKGIDIMLVERKTWDKVTLIFLILLGLICVATAADAPATIDPAKGCMTGECHSELNAIEFLHGPSNMGQCTPCHVTQGNRHQFEPMRQSKELCQLCHESEEPQSVVHAPFAMDCNMCHDPHGSGNRKYVKGGTGIDLCNLCHTDVRMGNKFQHGPVALGECLVCHAPHQSENENLLTETSTDLCFSCHVDFEETMEGAISIHEPAQKNCTGCHDAHGGETRIFTQTEGRALCQECHGEFLTEVEDFKFDHKPMSEGKSCENCHSVHASNQVALLSSTVSDLCLNCHNEQVKTNTRTLSNIKAQMDQMSHLHGPLREGNCVACHQAHGSDFDSILDNSFPTKFYSGYDAESYQLCFDCHDQKQVMSETSTVTGFRNGDVNLHYLHTNREKGRSCRACHHEHGSSNEKNIRAEVQYGKWKMPVIFELTETGGGCATGCHIMYKYDRENPVDNAVQAGQ